MPRRKTITECVLEKLIAAAILGIVSPVLLIAMLWIRLRSKGPVIFRQERVGYQMTPFSIYKLRTMDTNAEKTGFVTVRNDNRIIPGGQLLRMLKIDELPQLLNVLNGTMSLVGPRPTVEQDYERMTNRQKMRTRALPGLTGLAQVRGGASISWPERIEYDLLYIENQSFLLNLRILVETFLLLLTGKADQAPYSHDEWTPQSTPQGEPTA